MGRLKGTTYWPFALILALAGVACDRDRPERPRRPTRPVPSTASQLPPRGTGPSDAASAVPSALLELRARALELVPRSVPAERLAFVRGRIGQLTREALVVRDTRLFQVVASLPLEAPRRVVALADGSLLAIGRERTLRLAPHALRPEEYRRVSLFADSQVLADARDAKRFWVAHPGDRTLYLYSLSRESAHGMLPFEQLLTIEGCDHRGLTNLGDGSFVCTTVRGLRHFWPEGKRAEFPLPSAGGAVWRLLPGSRLDQLWVARARDRLELHQFGMPSPLRTLELGDELIEIVAQGKLLAAVSVAHAPNRSRQWWLRVLDDQGNELMRTAVPGAEDVRAKDWVAALLMERSVVLDREESQVAVGGPSSVTVWEARTGRELFSTDSAGH